MKRITVLSLITALLSLGLVTSCDKKAKKRKQMKKYDKTTKKIWKEEEKTFGKTTMKVIKFKKEDAKKFQKKLDEKLTKYKDLIARLEKVDAPNDTIKKIKKLDVKSLKLRRDIMKHWRDQVKEGKKPLLDKQYSAMEKEYRRLVQERESIRRKYYKKNRKRKSKKRKWKKRKKRKKR